MPLQCWPRACSRGRGREGRRGLPWQDASWCGASQGQSPTTAELPLCGGPRGEVREASPELSPEERRVVERKLKKERKKEEKKRLREAGIAGAQTARVQTPPASPSAAVLALEYLQGWAWKQESWRFQKKRQTWLLLHMYDEDKVPDEHFPTLLSYLEGLKGSARELTIQKAEALMQEMDEAGDPPLGKVQRLRQVLQLLS
ncbi:uncharacterized protein C7orf50 homolog isoform X2 [Meriones unguiculatus]|uniref:uncharacterized protein C7orf50 homolog isoform X2 n=1 Tax=Meriones unguiculatus TaxID=10047 RepID=UPI000B4F24D4|nr:uncharacterized protein C7orf50 homolog isoform X2 [Meriones unguiculatus]